MTAENFERALKRVLVYEGGYSNHPSDPGGATMKGVIQTVYDAYRDRKSEPRQSVKNLSEAELQEIYRKQYWDKIDGDLLPSGVDMVVFDGAVNSGPSRSAKWLQIALGFSGKMVDGDIGEMTLGKIRETQNLTALVDKICDHRMAFLKGLRIFATFGKGWSRRVDDVRSTGKSWVNNTPASPIVATSEQACNAKAV